MRIRFAVIIIITSLICIPAYCQVTGIDRYIELNAGTTLPEIKVGFKINPTNRIYLGLSYYFIKNQSDIIYYKAYSFDFDVHFAYNAIDKHLGRFYIGNSLEYVTVNNSNYDLYCWYLNLYLGRYFYVLPGTGLKIQAGVGRLLGEEIVGSNNMVKNDAPVNKAYLEISFFHKFGLKSRHLN